MKTETENTADSNTNLLGIKPALEAVFTDEGSRPSLRAWNKWRAKGYYPYIKKGRRVFIDPIKARQALEKRFTVKARDEEGNQLAIFSLAQVISITTGILCCEIGGVYEILNHITGDNLYTHALPRAGNFAEPLILQQYPELEAAGTGEVLQRLKDEIKAADEPVEGINVWLAKLDLPESFMIRSHADDWLSMNPVEELKVNNETLYK